MRKNKKSFSIKELSKITNSKFYGDENHHIFGVNSLEKATQNEASFLANPKYIERMKISNAGVICAEEPIESNKNFLLSKNPSKTFQAIVELFSYKSLSSFKGICENSFIHPSVIIGKNVTIGPNVTIDQNVSIADNTTIYPNTYIGANVSIGFDCTIYSNVSIRESVFIGNKVIIQPGVVIGSCGFGFILDDRGNYQKLNQIGTVIIEDDVEIGANTVIDRARFDQTIIKKGTKIDNLVQIGHNVEIGENNIIVAQAGISGSSQTGKHVVIGGQVGIAGHVKIESNVQIAAKSGVSKNLLKGAYRGIPAIPLKQWNRNKVLLNNIERLKKRIEKLEELIS